MDKIKRNYILRWCYSWLLGVPVWLLCTPIVALAALYAHSFLIFKEEVAKYLEQKRLSDIANTYKPERKKKNVR